MGRRGHLECTRAPRVKLLRWHKRVVTMSPHFQSLSLRGRQSRAVQGSSTPSTPEVQIQRGGCTSPGPLSKVTAEPGEHCGVLTPRSVLVILHRDAPERSAWSQSLISTGFGVKDGTFPDPWRRGRRRGGACSRESSFSLLDGPTCADLKYQFKSISFHQSVLPAHCVPGSDQPPAVVYDLRTRCVVPSVSFAVAFPG